MSTVDLDETDFALLQWLDEEGDVDADRASDELGISKSTVYYRLEQYREKGILKEKVAHLDPQKLGLGLMVITEIEAEYGEEGYEDLGEELASLSGVQGVYFMLGEMSFYVISRVRDYDHLQSLLEEVIKMEGIEDSVTNVVLRSFKDEPRLLVNYDEEDLEKIFE